jgi:hypothetical protein
LAIYITHVITYCAAELRTVIYTSRGQE